MNTARLKEWVSRLGKEEIPTFAQTARRMAAISCDNESSANDLAKVILQDTAMTARVLRLVNSVFYNPSNRKLDTVSYAIVVLGFEKVRNLALTVSMMESTIASNMMGHVKKEMACAYHAAIQAQRLAQKSGLGDTENIYIAALLHRLGQLMFWCFPYEHGDQLENLSDDPEAYKKVETDLLGFSLKSLTDSLITEWNLSPLLHDALNNKSFRDKKNACILHGFNIADCAKHSWDGTDMNRQVRAVSAMIGLPAEDTRTWLLENARSAETGLREMGLGNSKCIAKPHSKEKDEKNMPQNVIGIFNKKPVDNESRLEKQSRLLRQLTHLLNEELDLNHFLITMLESIHGATGCDQSFILLYKGKERGVVLKQHLGEDSKEIAGAAARLLKREDSSLSRALAQQSPCWSEQVPLLRVCEDSQFVHHNLMITPINAMGKHLGYVFAAKTKQGILMERDFECFRHFCDHASIAFRIFIRDKK